MRSAQCVPTITGASLEPLLGGSAFPMVIRPTGPVSDPTVWARSQVEVIDYLIGQHGALLFRGFALENAAQFESFAEVVCPGDWVEYREAATPRSHVEGHVFTSTEYYPEFRIYVHNENSHVTSWPQYILFFCKTPAPQGGDTPIADCRRVYLSLPPALLERFADKGWLYQRNFFPGSSITWQKTFGTSARADVEHYCEENHMVAKWVGDALTVRYRRWAAVRHPLSDDMVWFNHGTFFNPYTLEPAIKAAVLAMGEDKLPYNTYYGDGTPIEEETIKLLDATYSAETVAFPWRSGDVLMLDNMRMAHGRTPYGGRREVLVAMKRKVRCSDLGLDKNLALEC